MPNEPRSIRVADVFCGCGGTSEGLRQAGMMIAVGLDFEPDASATYRHSFPEAEFIERDLRQVEPPEIASKIDQGGDLLLLSACAPCQPFSMYRRKSSESRRSRTLLPSLLPFVEYLQPELIVVENVPGIENGSNGPLRRFAAGLKGLGYFVAWQVLDCQHFGVPQRRRRLILMASLFGEIAIPPATHGAGLKPVTTVGEFIAHFPELKAGEHHPEIPNHVCGALGDLSLRRLRASRELGGRLDWPDELWLRCHRTHAGHSDVYGCMDPDLPAPALTTKCTSLSNGRFGHPTQDRAISVREAASLQTFPDSFEFVGGLRSTTRQVGNAVPVLLARRVGEALLAHVAESASGDRLEQLATA
jgi:DNA (cytosine-5)-methyltransferase 1